MSRRNKHDNSRLKKLNPHINFDLEGSKINPRKQLTRVCCAKCELKFILPFRPRKPEVYCDNCFSKKRKLNKFD